MLLEVVSCKLFSWMGDKVADQPGRLRRALTLHRNHFPTGDALFNGAWDLIGQLLNKDPGSRPSMASVPLSPFFASDRFAVSTGATNLDWKFRILSTHLSSIRWASNRTPARIFCVQSEQTVVAVMLAVFADKSVQRDDKLFHCVPPMTVLDSHEMSSGCPCPCTRCSMSSGDPTASGNRSRKSWSCSCCS